MIAKKGIAIGQSDYKEMIVRNSYYIDKTLFIKEILEDDSLIILLPRPRRFGKTLNMTMLKYFFEATEESNRYLFERFNISEHEECMKHQGRYPVIYLTFKDVKCSNWQECLQKLCDVIKMEYDKYYFILEKGALSKLNSKDYEDILFGKINKTKLEWSLERLTKYLYAYYNVKPIILIDEYDVPIQSGFMNGYYDEVIEFMKNFLSAGLKDNQNLHKCVLTGIFRIAKESLFSGLNNLNVCTILDYEYSDKFGFLETEVKQMLKYHDIEDSIKDVRDWYNGYIFGGTVIYNPWSIINYVRKRKKEPSPYWVNTSDNELIKDIVARGDEELKLEFKRLIEGKEIEKAINPDIVMEDIEKDNNNIWNFLLFTGYLKVVAREKKNRVDYYRLKIPNEEVLYLYEQTIINWFSANKTGTKLKNMLGFLTQGNVPAFNRLFKQLILATFSYFDITSQEPERVYQAFVLGMFISLKDRYEVKSNRESGIGRADVMLIPNHTANLGIIIEFKVVYQDEGKTLESEAANALKQIKTKQYDTEFLDRGVHNILKLGIAFCGKEVLVKSE